MKYFIALSCALFLGNATLVNAARNNERKQNTPVMEDQTNRAEAYAVRAATYNSVKLYTPRQSLNPVEERKVMIQNMDSNRCLHITTWSVPTVQVMNSSTTEGMASWVLYPSTYGTASTLVLNTETTFYGRYDQGGPAGPATGASSGTIRIFVHSVDQSLFPK